LLILLDHVCAAFKVVKSAQFENYQNFS